jgi:nicotinate phosphoribosyltransferase
MIIQSLLDNDFYKFTMGQAVFTNFPDVEVEYEFRCRNKDTDLTKIAPNIIAELKNLCSLRFKSDELEYLSKIRFIKPAFVEFLRNLQLNFDYVEVKAENRLEIIVRGPWLFTIWFEVPILATVNEIYFKNLIEDAPYLGAEDRLKQKIDIVEHCKQPIVFSDFGTRRRFSRNWHEHIVDMLTNYLKPENFIGTSNVWLAKEKQINVVGTMAHEWIMAMQALTRTLDSQKFAFECWSKTYRGDLGIALSDTLGSEAFFKDFDLYFSKLFDGARHDSGDPFEWGKRLIKHYEEKRINPKTKVALFSDGLTFPVARDLVREFSDFINVRFGIGTDLTNDFPDLIPLNIVMKMTKCNGHPVAKISNSPGKTICNDESYITELKRVFSIQ